MVSSNQVTRSTCPSGEANAKQPTSLESGPESTVCALVSAAGSANDDERPETLLLTCREAPPPTNLGIVETSTGSAGTSDAQSTHESSFRILENEHVSAITALKGTKVSAANAAQLAAHEPGQPSPNLETWPQYTARADSSAHASLGSERTSVRRLEDATSPARGQAAETSKGSGEDLPEHPAVAGLA